MYVCISRRSRYEFASLGLVLVLRHALEYIESPKSQSGTPKTVIYVTNLNTGSDIPEQHLKSPRLAASPNRMAPQHMGHCAALHKGYPWVQHRQGEQVGTSTVITAVLA